MILVFETSQVAVCSEPLLLLGDQAIWNYNESLAMSLLEIFCSSRSSSSVVPKLISLSSSTVACPPSSKAGGASSTSSFVALASDGVPSSIVI